MLPANFRRAAGSRIAWPLLFAPLCPTTDPPRRFLRWPSLNSQSFASAIGVLHIWGRQARTARPPHALSSLPRQLRAELLRHASMREHRFVAQRLCRRCSLPIERRRRFAAAQPRPYGHPRYMPDRGAHAVE